MIACLPLRYFSCDAEKGEKNDNGLDWPTGRSSWSTVAVPSTPVCDTDTAIQYYAQLHHLPRARQGEGKEKETATLVSQLFGGTWLGSRSRVVISQSDPSTCN